MKESEAGARDAATAFRERHGLASAPIGDLQKLIESLEIDMILRALPPGVDAFAVKDPETGKTFLAVGTTDNAERQRFTIAHELGHIEFNDFVEGAAPHSPEHPNEDEAHTFARHLLIPVDAMESRLDEMNVVRGQVRLEHLSSLVQTFGVSPHVVTRQLEDNGWTGAEQQSWKDLAAAELAARYGWESERSALVLAAQRERPSQRLAIKALDAYQRGWISESALASMLGERVSEVAERLNRAGIPPKIPDPRGDRVTIEIDDL